MKKTSRILQICAAVLLTVISVFYLFLEGRMLLSGDWLLHEQPAAAFVQYTLRLILAGFSLFCAIRAASGRIPVFGAVCLTAAAAGISLFSVNSIGLYMLLAALLFLAANLFRYRYAK